MRLFQRHRPAVADQERLARTDGAAATGRRQPGPTGRGAGRRVLIVEDDDSLRRLLMRNLEAHGHRPRQAIDVASALAALAAETPEILILDLNLPDASGWDVLRLARLEGSTAVVVLTAGAVSPKTLARFRPVAYLPKPFPLEALIRLVEQCRGRDEAQDDAQDA